ncbi:IclR family transcriptional regulator [Roseinatronobacter sp. NSM]|uniref:IclR family transcriptional regulator n=1 Tax=Roseinatronobacter sp. NSM TaxID=3457785 RepID=UPI004036E154
MNKPVETTGKAAGQSSGDETRYRAPALDKGLDILELLANEPGGLTRSEIVRAMNRSPSEIYRMIERLVARAYICRSAEGDRYALTMKLFLLGAAHPPLRRLVSQAQPLMNDFARRTIQSVHLVLQEGPCAAVVAQASHRANWEFRLQVGAQLDMLSTGSGQTLLAFQDDSARARILQAIQTVPQGIDAARRAMLDKVRKAGYRMEPSQQLVGVTDISVPIFGMDGNAIAVLTCPYIQRLDTHPASDVSVSDALEVLRDTANQIALH